MNETTILKETGRYRVVLPMLPRHRTQKYLVVAAENANDAASNAIRIVETDRIRSGLRNVWISVESCEVEELVAPVFETVDEKDARSDRARQRAIEARARRANR